MGFLKELGKYLVKYGEIALNKTEILTHMAKLKIEIKKREMEIEKIKIEIGDYVIDRVEKKEEINSEIIKFKINDMNTFKLGIEDLRIKLDSLKSQLWENSYDNKEIKKAV